MTSFASADGFLKKLRYYPFNKNSAKSLVKGRFTNFYLLVLNYLLISFLYVKLTYELRAC